MLCASEKYSTKYFLMFPTFSLNVGYIQEYLKEYCQSQTTLLRILNNVIHPNASLLTTLRYIMILN